MELDLTRVDYTIVGLTSRNCLKLIPASYPKDLQKIAIADNDGIFQIFSIRKEDIQLHFKSLPGPKSTAVQISGNDKIFVASENEVKAYTTKGKLFLTFDPGLTESITSMFVLENDLFLCGNHIYNHYRDCKDVGSYLCGDRIIDVIAFHGEKSRRLMSLIACEGRMIRALEHGRVTLSMEVESAPTVLHIFEDDKKIILFGTIDGRVGVLDVERMQGFERWLLNDQTSSAISSLAHYDIVGNGTKNLIVGRQDGTIEVFVLNMEDTTDAPILVYSHNCNESITALQCGTVSSPGFDEIIVATFTGKIFGLTTAKLDNNLLEGDGGAAFSFSQDVNLKISRLKNEIEDLQMKLVKERERYQTSTQSIFDEFSAIPLLSINDSFILCKETSIYVLSVEVPTPIDNILLHSDVALDLLDVEKNSAVVSHSDNENVISKLDEGILVTYRCQINTNRLEIKIRTIEGQRGMLKVYVTPLVQPKCSRLKTYDIKPLSLHYRIHGIDDNKPFNCLTIKGPFSLAEMHSWINSAVPEVPEKAQITENVLYFQSSLLNTVLVCTYKKGEAVLKSDNLSTISILKEFLTMEATKKKIKIEINFVIEHQSINYVLEILHPKLVELKEVEKNLKLLKALDEFEANEEETLNYFCDKYKNLILNEKDIKNRATKQTDQLARIYSLIQNLYIDYGKFKGINVKADLGKLSEILMENCNQDTLINFFRPQV